MTKKTPANLLAICEAIADGMKPLDAATLQDVSARSFFNFLKQSREKSDPTLVVDWQGTRMSFASAVRAARLSAVRGDASPSASGATVVHHVHVYHHFPEAVGRPGKAEPDDLFDLLGPEPEPVPDAPELEPVAIDQTPNRPPRNALEADLFARLAAARAKNAPGATDEAGKLEGAPAGS